MFIDASGCAANFIPQPTALGVNPTDAQSSAHDAAEAMKTHSEIARMIAEGIDAFIDSGEYLKKAHELGEEAATPSKDDKKREEKEIRKRINDDDQKAAMLGFMKDYMVTSLKVTTGVLSAKIVARQC